jgi:hypothetical protein
MDIVRSDWVTLGSLHFEELRLSSTVHMVGNQMRAMRMAHRLVGQMAK